MITVEAILIDGVAKPKEVIEAKFGSHFDGINFYYFESEEERKEFYDNIAKNIQDEIINEP